jgi:hypothetical protein
MPDPLNNRDLTVVIKVLQGTCRWMKGQAIAYRQDVILVYGKRWSAVVINAVGIRDYCVHEIVAAGELDNYKGVFFIDACAHDN